MEAMALESLVASVWRLEGFLTVVRHSVRVKGGYSDLDVVGVRDRSVRVAECKARGPARQVTVEGDARSWCSAWEDSLDNLHLLWEQRPDWLPPVNKVLSLNFQLVGNVWFVTESVRKDAEKRLTVKLRNKLPPALRRKAQASVVPSIELLITAIKKVRRQVVDQRWGKRYGDPLLDALRELIRYAHPAPVGGGRRAREISSAVRRRLELAVFGRHHERGDVEKRPNAGR